MIGVPLYIFLFIYLGILLCLLGLAFINIKHLFRTGTFTLASFVATFLFLAFSALVLWATWYLLQNTNWQESITVWNNSWISNAFNTGEAAAPFNF